MSFTSNSGNPLLSFPNEKLLLIVPSDGPPHGTADLSTALTSLQPYDVSLFLHLPRTPSNLAAGNFMLDVSLLAPLKASSTTPSILATSITSPNTTLLAQSRRPAILTYVSPLVDTASTLSGIPFYVLGWKRESEALEISVFEGVEFAKGWRNVPRYVRVAIEADEKMQFYEVGVRVLARFGGLRWMVYQHRVLSYLFFTTSFWMGSMLSCAVAWVLISIFLSDSSGQKVGEDQESTNRAKVKEEAEDEAQFDPTSMEDLSDTSRSFPTLGRQLPLHFIGRKDNIKHEDDLAENVKREEDRHLDAINIQPLGAEADDEDDDEAIVSWRDSGVGTSLEDTDRRRSVQKRRKALFGGSSQ